MKLVMLFAIASTILFACAFSPRPAAQQNSASTKPDSPFYCDRKAIKPEQLARKEELGKTLRSLKTTTRELPDGFEFQFPSDASTVQAVAEWATMERLCCPFFDIDLRLEREGGKFWLRLTGREGVKQFIHADFFAWFQQ